MAISARWCRAASILIEVKSHFDGDRRLVTRMADVLGRYSGPVAGMSFDPDQVLALREAMPELTRGIVAERIYSEADWPEASAAQRNGHAASQARAGAPGRISSPIA